MTEVASNIANLFAAIGIAAGTISAGTVLTAGVILAGGIYLLAKAGEKIEDIKRTASKRQQYEICCCNLIGPSGKFKNHFIMKKSRKEAEEAARHYGNANGVELHAHNTRDNYPHFHPTRDGNKIPGVHFQFPSI